MENRETNTIELPSGIKADIIVGWTFREFQEIEAVKFKAAKNVRTVDGEAITEIDGSAIIEMQATAIRLACKKLTAADGTDMPVSADSIGDLSMDDGVALHEAVEKISGSLQKK